MVSDQIKRRAVHAQGGFAIAVGGALGKLLVLVVVHGNAHAAGRRVAVQMGGHDDQPVVLALLGDQPQVGGQEGTRGFGALVVLVVGVGAGVVALLPAQVAGVVVVAAQAVAAVVMARAFEVVRQLGGAVWPFTLALVVDGVGVDLQGQAHQAVGVARHQLAQVQPVALPVTVAVRRQAQRLLPQVAAVAGVRVIGVEVVVLQIAGDVIGEHFERLHLHRAGTHRLERHAESLAGGQNHAVTDEANAGFGHPQHQVLGELAVRRTRDALRRPAPTARVTALSSSASPAG